MTDVFQIEIAGVRFSTELGPGVRVIETDSIYRFFQQPTSPALPPIEVTVELGFERAPDLLGLPVLFETGESWVAHQDGEDVILSMPALLGRQGLMWAARVHGGGNGVSLHCGPDLVDREGDETLVANPLRYPLDQLLLLFVLAGRGGTVVHAAGVAADGVGALFAGRSGAGKTTLMRQLEGCTDLEGLSDDRVAIRSVGGELQVCGTPWAGEGLVAANRSARLGAVVLLHKSDRTRLESISPAEAVAQLLPTTSVLWFDRERMSRTLELCEQMVEQVGVWELHFAPEPGVAEVVKDLLASVR